MSQSSGCQLSVKVAVVLLLALMASVDSEEARLPQELERRIFEEAAASDPDCALSLLQTARRVQSWIEPRVYTTLVLGYEPERIPWFSKSDTAQLHLQLSAAFHTKPTSFFAKHVRNIYFGDISEDETQLVVSSCTAASNLVFEVIWNPPSFPNIYQLPLRRLTMSFRLACLTVVPEAPKQLFPNLSNLTLYHSSQTGDTEAILTVLAALPALTHLCVCIVQEAELLRAILDRCPRLEVLLHAFDAGMYTRELYIADMEEVDDPRCVLLDLTCGAMNWNEWVFEDWRLANAGQPDLLARASAFVAQKRTGEIPSTRFEWDDPDGPGLPEHFLPPSPETSDSESDPEESDDSRDGAAT
ncbi:hypothetical protein HMN09_00552600 [Mycena chlorophos]|uniref:F-box domain-containing protein n=1 Tax=Mycena chlorophos TaxID=658473 RepID=A0A8H6TBT2_MYCCL|nr:hypothetical protein HMN09_00552600 [Mycena chlorophos]